MFKRRTSGAISCPRCGRLVDVNARFCPSCNAWRPGVWGFGPSLMQVRRLPVREMIVGFCMLMYAASLMIFRPEASGGVLALFAPSDKALFAIGATGRPSVFHFGRWETLVTAVFLHGNLLHILFNGMWTWQMGPVMNELYDSARFFLIFVIAGAVGNLASVMVGRSLLLIGASGGVYGIFGALVWYGYKRGGVVGSRILQFGMLWGGIGLALSFVVPCFALWAHIGGFVAGFLCGALFGYDEVRRSGPWTCLLALAVGLVVLAAFFLYLGLPPREFETLLQLQRDKFWEFLYYHS